MVNKDTREYSLILMDRHGSRHSIKAVGLESIAEVKHAPDGKPFRHMFPNRNKDIIRAFDRPHGNVDVMLGMELSRLLHCREGYEVGRTRACLPRGWVLTGQAPAEGVQRGGFRVKAKTTAQRIWALPTHMGSGAMMLVQKKGKTTSGKKHARGGGADHDKARCKPGTTTISGGPAGVCHRRSV